MLEYKIISPADSLYPYNLKQLSDRPKRLYLAGSFAPSDQKAIAIVGSRRMTDFGKKTAWEFSSALSKAGVTVISGIARGVDTVAHKAAIFAGGRTIAVLGSGIDVIYPPENIFLAREIAVCGAVITEFPPGTPPDAKNFLSRNRIVSGLSLGVLVIEGLKRSGTLSTASHAARDGKEVFAIPGSEATDWLIEEGATSVTRPKDILDMLV